MKTARSCSPTPPTPAGSMPCSAPTTTSTSPPRAATTAPIPTGHAAAMNTRPRRGDRRPRPDKHRAASQAQPGGADLRELSRPAEAGTLGKAGGQALRVGVQGVVAARTAHAVGGSCRIGNQVDLLRIGVLIGEAPVLALVDLAPAPAAGQVAIRIDSLSRHGDPLLRVLRRSSGIHGSAS